MEKIITILAIDEEISIFLKQELEKIFGDLFEIEYRNLDMEPIPPIYNSDLILYTDPEMLNRFISIIKCDVPKLMMKRTITRDALKKIKAIPAGKRVLVANINQYMANETMALIYQLGVTNIELFPYYKGKKDVPEVDYIINVDPKKFDFLPDIDAKIITIGHRVFDISNILDILSILRVKNKKTEEIIKKYMFKLPTFWHGIQYTLENRNILITQLNMILDDLSNGVIVTDDMDRIEFVNTKASEILNISQEKIMGITLDAVSKDDERFRKLLKKNEVKNELIQYQGKDLVVTLKVVRYDDNYHGKVIMLSPYFEMVEVQQKIHKKIIGKGYYSKYYFSKMVGCEPNFSETKDICKKIASSDSTVLLLGESGTGKEVFAGSIHNASMRKNQPFVAINCATLPETLLESELFGYEEGAFTGAKKGGKIGLFERAHRGTIFLDEIGDLPLNLQARLLRAIEEKEIMRVGGDGIISIDVRVIAATNKNLMKLVEEGKFRQDLFYRLNVFQIIIPPLRDRINDIKPLAEHFLAQWGVKRYICEDFRTFCYNYSWPGNVRELKNVLEYMVTISEFALSFDNLPSYLKDKKNYVNDKHDGSNLLLKILYFVEKIGGNTGRRTLHKIFCKTYYEISEMEIRELLNTLYMKDMIKISKGREGNSLLPKGIDFLKNNRYIDESIEEEYMIKMKKMMELRY